MKTVGLFEAKTHLSALVDKARVGQVTLITARGKPAACIVPVQNDAPEDAVTRLLANTCPMGISIREAIDQGRT
jgi:prevent-host-death family protein